jgi:hypothetical protein
MFTTEQMLQLVEDYKLLILDSAEDRNAILGKNGSAKMGQKWVGKNGAKMGQPELRDFRGFSWRRLPLKKVPTDPSVQPPSSRARSLSSAARVSNTARIAVTSR